MSRTSPGRYAVHEFARNVYDVQIDDGRWRAARRRAARIRRNGMSSGTSGTVRVRYKVFGDHLNGTHLAIDSTHAHMNIPASLMWARGFESRPVRSHVRRSRRVEGRDPAASHVRSADVYCRQPAVPDRQSRRAERVHACGPSPSIASFAWRFITTAATRTPTGSPRLSRKSCASSAPCSVSSGVRGAVHVHRRFSAVGAVRRDGAPQQHHPDRTGATSRAR